MKTLEFNTREAIQTYIADLQATLDRLDHTIIEQAIAALHRARLDGAQVFVMGNGGSASTAGHIVCDLAKNTRCPGVTPFKVIGLADNIALLSAYANDEGYDSVFAQQLDSLAHPNDIAIAISTSGNSPNVLRAVELARERGVLVISMTGFNGGRLAVLSDINLHIDSDQIDQVEDLHLMLEHLMVRTLRVMAS